LERLAFGVYEAAGVKYIQESRVKSH
jgi:hypothetical protein